MAAITLRRNKGDILSYDEVDNNFVSLNNAKIEEVYSTTPAQLRINRTNLSVSVAIIGLDRVNNTSDKEKPLSDATIAALTANSQALNLKLDKAGGKITGQVETNSPFISDSIIYGACFASSAVGQVGGEARWVHIATLAVAGGQRGSIIVQGCVDYGHNTGAPITPSTSTTYIDFACDNNGEIKLGTYSIGNKLRQPAVAIDLATNKVYIQLAAYSTPTVFLYTAIWVKSPVVEMPNGWTLPATAKQAVREYRVGAGDQSILLNAGGFASSGSIISAASVTAGATLQFGSMLQSVDNSTTQITAAGFGVAGRAGINFRGQWRWKTLGGDDSAGAATPLYKEAQSLSLYASDEQTGETTHVVAFYGTRKVEIPGELVANNIRGMAAKFAAKQDVLGWTPVQQGGGTGQGTNKLNVGWTGDGLTLFVDNQPQGPFAMRASSSQFTVKQNFNQLGSSSNVFNPFAAGWQDKASLVAGGSYGGGVVLQDQGGFGGIWQQGTSTLFGSGNSSACHAVIVATYEGATSIFRGNDDDQVYLGASWSRWKSVYAVNGTILTSDSRFKTKVEKLNDAEIKAAIAISDEIGTFRWLDKVAAEGDSARLHVGVTVQKVIEIMQANGLSPMMYGMVCYDKWGDEYYTSPEIVAVPATAARPAEYNERGVLISAAIPGSPGIEGSPATKRLTREAGDRYSLRYEQLSLFIAAGLRRRQLEIEKRLAALEAK